MVRGAEREGHSIEEEEKERKARNGTANPTVGKKSKFLRNDLHGRAVALMRATGSGGYLIRPIEGGEKRCDDDRVREAGEESGEVNG